MALNDTAEIGVFGGSGFYSLLSNVREVDVETPFGKPSDSLFLATHAGRRVAFLPRHGRAHTIPPHRINYRANVWAMKSLGVRFMISPCAAGSLQSHIAPEHFVLCDQYVDRTSGRADTFFDGPEIHHVSAAQPYCPLLRQMALEVINSHRITVHAHGTVVVVQGPRFSTRSESKWYTGAGWDVINMTQYPEAHLCIEQEIAVVNICLVTDYDAGLASSGAVSPVTSEEVYRVFLKNAERVKKVTLDLIERIAPELNSPHHHALQGAKIG
ncbi:MAG TPA: S-methyl-5'-thioadenosine phosphorylase [Chthonomonadales bacterium]|nr:S-methyl-5'-thioadenosine phosphorylase [Chthonomonadales bacterium]